MWVKCDVTKEEEVKNAVEETVRQFGTLHVAVTCAGLAMFTFTYHPKHEMNLATWHKSMQINVYGSVYVAKYASIHMSKNKPINELGEKGVIIFVSSITS